MLSKKPVVRLTGQKRHQYSTKKFVGREFGSLIVSGFDGSDDSGHTYWRCLCVCGKIAVERTDNLTSGRTRSCGCKQNGGLK